MMCAQGTPRIVAGLVGLAMTAALGACGSPSSGSTASATVQSSGAGASSAASGSVHPVQPTALTSASVPTANGIQLKGSSYVLTLPYGWKDDTASARKQAPTSEVGGKSATGTMVVSCLPVPLQGSVAETLELIKQSLTDKGTIYNMSSILLDGQPALGIRQEQTTGVVLMEYLVPTSSTKGLLISYAERTASVAGDLAYISILQAFKWS